ncbi:hypothetical protein ABZX75_07070 [Streptomyces sp. NPDC003038]|uniref:hypothetical protein n=1 Tax=unclassified Streptomyces TaxID=2593676 RepID=UPI0033AE8BDC
MRVPPVTAAFALAALASMAIAAAPAGDDEKDDLDIARFASGAFHAPELAVEAGFVATNECVRDTQGGQGGTGYRYVNRDNIGSLHPGRPAAVLYATDKEGVRQLVAVEYIVVDPDNDPDTVTPPKLFGRTFDGPITNVDGLPVHYSLHVWLWKHNPSGLFAPYNPSVTCP